jgi:hypothetical protein
MIAISVFSALGVLFCILISFTSHNILFVVPTLFLFGNMLSILICPPAFDIFRLEEKKNEVVAERLERPRPYRGLDCDYFDFLAKSVIDNNEKEKP